MEEIKAIIIDDEPLARDLIRNYLKEYSQITVLEECGDGFHGLKAIQEHQPDLVILDIQMPKITGFEMLELIEHPPIIIFSTAFNEYAIKAFEKNAVDYLLKPFSRTRFAQAIEKAMETHRLKLTQRLELQQLQQDVTKLEGEKLNRVVVKNGSKIHVVPVTDLFYLEAQDDYVMLYTADGKYLKQQTMKYFESMLDEKQFVRIHRSYIVNINCISRLEHYEKESYRAVLHSKLTLPVSKAGHALLKQVLGI